jgi:hypothetical protein
MKRRASKRNRHNNILWGAPIAAGLGLVVMEPAPSEAAPPRPSGAHEVRTICPNGEAPTPNHSGCWCGSGPVESRMVAPPPDDPTCRPTERADGPYCVWSCGNPTTKASSSGCYRFDGKSVPCPDPDASDTFVCAGTNYVWLVPRAGGNCGGDPGPEGGIYEPEPSKQTAAFIPPPAIGEIYTVVEYKQTGRPAHPWQRGSANAPTSIAVGWGGWHPHGLVPPAAGKSGFVLKLHHVATDSVPLLIATDGNITTGPSQGRPPPEWTDPAYQPIQWP